MSEHIMHTYRLREIEFVSGSGARLVSAEGDPYIDLIAGIAVAALGHAHPALTAVISEQAARLIHVSNLYETPPQRELAARLFELTAGMKSFFCNSGSEAVECALKITRKRGPGRIVCTEGGFHGRTLGSLSATGQPSKRDPFVPLVDGFTHVPFGDADAIERELTADDVAAVLLEPIQGEAGVIVPPDGYLSAVRAACDEAGALLILDEVQTGVGRTGTWWAHEHDGIRPDLMCIAKGLGGGLPIGACLAAGAPAGVLAPGDHGATFGGGPVQCAAACTVLEVIEKDDLMGRATDAGERLREGLQAIWPDAVVGGRGLLLGVDFGKPVAREITALCARAGVLVNDVTPSVMRVAPPLVISDDDIDDALARMKEACLAKR